MATAEPTAEVRRPPMRYRTTQALWRGRDGQPQLFTDLSRRFGTSAMGCARGRRRPRPPKRWVVHASPARDGTVGDLSVGWMDPSREQTLSPSLLPHYRIRLPQARRTVRGASSGKVDTSTRKRGRSP